MLACLLGFSVISWAYPVRWTLDNFLFEDGGVAEGSFVLDGYTQFSDIRLTTTTGPGYPGSAYDTTFGAFDPYIRDFSLGGPMAEGSSVLTLGWYPAALGDGAAVLDTYFAEGSCTDFALDPGGNGYCGSLGSLREGLPGARLVGTRVDIKHPAVIVPEPDVVVLMGLGIAGIAFVRITRKRHPRATRR